MTFYLLMGDSGGLGGLFSALGLNWESFLLNLAAFLVTAYVVGKWVFPPLTKALDAKRDELESAAKLEQTAKHSLDDARDQAAQIVAEARTTADGILAGAR